MKKDSEAAWNDLKDSQDLVTNLKPYVLGIEDFATRRIGLQELEVYVDVLKLMISDREVLLATQFWSTSDSHFNARIELWNPEQEMFVPVEGTMDSGADVSVACSKYHLQGNEMLCEEAEMLPFLLDVNKTRT